MKKAITFFIGAAALLALSACVSHKAVDLTASIEDTSLALPAWTGRAGFTQGGIRYEAGFARSKYIERAQKRAEANGRNKIAFWIETDAASALLMYAQESGLDDESDIEDLEDLLEEIARDVAESAYSDSLVMDACMDGERGAYVLVGYDLRNLAAELQRRVDSCARNESASLAEFNAEAALRFLFE